MAITVEEKYGRQLSDKSAERLYVARGESGDTETTARNVVKSTAPASVDGIPLDDVDMDELGPGQGGGLIWLATVSYRLGNGAQATSESGFEFDTTGGQEKLFQSLATQGSYAASSTPTDYKGAIGVTEDRVEGVSIHVPKFAFTVTRNIPSANMTESYIGDLFRMTGKTNDAQWSVTTDDGITITLSGGEALFLGATGSYRAGKADWRVRFAFAGSPNRLNFAIDPITGIDKLGWEYLWLRYRDEKDAVSGRLAKRPVEAYVEKVYETGDFTTIL